MIQVVGLRHDVRLDLREKLSIIPKRCEEALVKLKGVCKEAVILSTCNRTEIYFSAEVEGEILIQQIFQVLDWDYTLVKHMDYKRGENAITHLMEVTCGFDSIVLGEDQILGQVKTAFEISQNIGSVDGELLRLFQTAITCGKQFRHKAELYKIPVSSSSISIKVAKEKNVKNFMILGFGEVGQLTSKYILGTDFDTLYIAVRNADVVDLEDPRVKVIPFGERQKFYDKVECIIACTSAPHPVVHKEEITSNKELLIFDLAVPRNVEESVLSLEQVTVYDIDELGKINDKNHKLRNKLMCKYKFVIQEHGEEFLNWQRCRELSTCISQIKDCGEDIYKKRYKTFKNKVETKDKNQLAETLLKSTSDVYVHRAIEVLKEEHLKGRAEECMKILGKIFPMSN